MSTLPIESPRLRHLVGVCQRMKVQVGFGIALVLLSHAFKEKDEREWLRDAGSGIVTFAVSHWLTGQGRQRIHPKTGKPLRHPTIRISSEQVQQMRDEWKRQEGRS